MHTDTCDPSWQSTRDGLIITVHVISDLAFLVEVVAAGLACVAIYCGKSMCTKEFCVSFFLVESKTNSNTLTS